MLSTAPAYERFDKQVLAAVSLIVIVKAGDAVSNLEDVRELSVSEELQNVRQLVVHVLAETLWRWPLHIVEETSEEAEVQSTDALCVPRDEFLVVLV